MATATLSKAASIRQEINKFFGDEVLHSGAHERFIVKYILTNLLPIDILLQGGIPRGRFTMIQGDWSTLKTYIGLWAAAQVQREGGVAAIIDTEHAFDPQWALDIGCNIDDLIIEHPENGELAIDVAEGLVRAGVDLIVFDSISATLPQAEQEKRLYKENVQPARQAALFSVACRKLTTANTGKTAFIWINQFRENIGITFGPREKATGGRALPYYMSYILEVRKVGKVTRDEQMFTGEKWQNTKVQIAQKFKAELIKSKLNKPFREIWFDWDLTTSSIDLVSFLITQGIEQGHIKKSGNTWTYGTGAKGLKAVGKDKFKAALTNSLPAQQALTVDIRKWHGMPVLPGTAEAVAVSTGKRPSPPKKVTPGKKAMVKPSGKKQLSKR